MTAIDPEKLTQLIRSESIANGFELVGICPAVQPPGLTRFNQWLESGFHGEMSYMSDRQDAYEHPTAVLDGATSVVMLALNYKTAVPNDPPPGFARVARYALSNTDYHDTIHKKLKAIKREVLNQHQQCSIRGVVDTAPLLERDFARLSGLGWFGKNTMLINKTRGSYFFLAALLIDQPMIYDSPFNTTHCGTCTACLTECPTDAFDKAGVLDARKCISYLTIELRGAIPLEFRDAIGNWLFGCDVCQDVCPWNNKAPETSNPEMHIAPGFDPLDLNALFEMDDDRFRDRFRKTPLWRAKRRGILRNAAVVLGNQQDPSALASLEKGINDSEEIVRGACAWAIGKIGGEAAIHILEQRAKHETDPDVAQEISAAIKRQSAY